MKIELDKYPIIKTFNSDNSRGELNYKLTYTRSFRSGSNKILLPFKTKSNFWNYANNLALKKAGKLSELIFFGLNYNAKRIKYFRKPYVLDLQKSHKIKVAEFRLSVVKTKVFKRRILFWSYDRTKLNELVNCLKKQRPQNSYSGHGLITKETKYATKPGKIRQK